jgi:diguanylate cyclase (GGDEF)-like protein
MQGEHDLSLATRQTLKVCLVFLDLDGFKKVNDEFGHAEGDRVLVKFTELLKSSLRDSDTLGRLGGDEFALLLTNSNASFSQTVIDKFNSTLDAYNQSAKHTYSIRFSYGIVEYDPGKHASLEALLKEGDAIMYEQKKRKKEINKLAGNRKPLFNFAVSDRLDVANGSLIKGIFKKFLGTDAG